MKYRLLLLIALLGTSTALDEDRLLVPGDAELSATSATVQDIHKQQTANAKTPADRLALATKLLQDGLATQDDQVRNVWMGNHD